MWHSLGEERGPEGTMEHDVRIHDLAERVTRAMSAGVAPAPADELSLTDLLGRVARELQVSQRPGEHSETR
jgi:hypothetical protein